MICLVVIFVLVAQMPPEVHAGTIGLFSDGTDFTGFVLNESRIMYLVSTFENPWRKCAQECDDMDGEILKFDDIKIKQNLDVVPDNRISRSTTYFVDGRKKYGGTWAYGNGTKMSINSALWHQGEPNGPGNKAWNVCAGLYEGLLIDYYCLGPFMFICQTEILPFLRLPREKGHIELKYNGIWGPLCFDLGLSAAENGEICQDQYDLLYKTFSNIYTYPDYDEDPDDYEYWYDNEAKTCSRSKLHCEGEAPGAPVIEFEKGELYMGKSLILGCTVVGGIPKPTIGWNRQGKDLVTKETWKRPNEKVVFSGNTSMTLTSDDDKVPFQCVVNYAGNTSYYKKHVNLNVSYPPIMTVPNYVETNETDDVIIECLVTSNPLPTVTWIWPAETEVSVGPTLSLTNVYRTAIGSYTCRAENIFRGQRTTEENTTMLYINAPPKMCLYQREFTEENDTVVMRCSATGVPTPTITWYRRSELTQNTFINTNSAHHVIESVVAPDNPYLVTSLLTVSDAGDGDLLGYQCSVTNDNDVIQKTFRIHRKLKCRCLSRFLKNCVPLKLEPETLAATLIETKEKLSVKKEELTSTKLKLISSNDDRSSSSAIGLLGVSILVTFGVMLICFDLIGYFVIKPHYKHSSKTKRRKQTNARSNIEASLSLPPRRCRDDFDIKLTDVDDSDQKPFNPDQGTPTPTVSRNRTTTTAEVHSNPTMSRNRTTTTAEVHSNPTMHDHRQRPSIQY